MVQYAECYYQSLYSQDNLIDNNIIAWDEYLAIVPCKIIPCQNQELKK